VILQIVAIILLISIQRSIVRAAKKIKFLQDEMSGLIASAKSYSRYLRAKSIATIIGKILNFLNF